MNQVLKSLYEQWCDTHKDTPEYDFACDVLCKSSENITLEQENYNFDILTDCMRAESEQAFCAGFRAAVQLLVNSL